LTFCLKNGQWGLAYRSLTLPRQENPPFVMFMSPKRQKRVFGSISSSQESVFVRGMAVIGDIVNHAEGATVTTARKLNIDDPMTEKATRAIGSKGASQRPMTQREIGLMLVSGLDVILQARMERRRSIGANESSL